MSNITPNIRSKLERKLHNQVNHPIWIIKNHIYKFFKSSSIEFVIFDDLPSSVGIQDNFDSLLIPSDHVSRSKTDTYYVDDNIVLRTHTSAHQVPLLKQGYTSFLVTGDVYRKDEIDKYHYPIFHQMEGLSQCENPDTQLKDILSKLIEYLFPGYEYRFNPDHFPFVDPGYEIEVFFKDKWIEVLGCGVVKPEISNKPAWAFGLGLDRLAMIFFQIPDIRLLWSENPKFLSQFDGSLNTVFREFSNLDPIYRDISFWIPGLQIKNWDQINDFYDLIRSQDDLLTETIQEVKIFDTFYSQKYKRYSYTFRITFNPLSEYSNPAEFNNDVNTFMEKLRSELPFKLNISLR